MVYCDLNLEIGLQAQWVEIFLNGFLSPFSLCCEETQFKKLMGLWVFFSPCSIFFSLKKNGDGDENYTFGGKVEEENKFGMHSQNEDKIGFM